MAGGDHEGGWLGQDDLLVIWDLFIEDDGPEEIHEVFEVDNLLIVFLEFEVVVVI